MKAHTEQEFDIFMSQLQETYYIIPNAHVMNDAAAPYGPDLPF